MTQTPASAPAALVTVPPMSSESIAGGPADCAEASRPIPTAISDPATRPVSALRATIPSPPKILPKDQPAANWRTLESYARLGPKYGTRAEKRRKVRKVPASPAARLEFDAFTVDLDQRTLYRHGESVPLPSRAFDTLVY